MNNLRSPVHIQELEAVNSEFEETQSLSARVRQEYNDVSQDLQSLIDEKAHVLTRISPDRLLTPKFRECISAAVGDLDECIRTQSQASQLVRERLREAETKLETIRERRRSLLSYVSPAQVVPEEIWVKIWTWADVVPRSIRSTQLPFVLSWVSRRWREALLRTPTMWCFVQTSPNTSPALLRLQVQRSACCLLKIFFSFRSAFPTRTVAKGGLDGLLDILSELVQCSNRWESFHFGETCRYKWDQCGEVPLYSDKLQDLLRGVHTPHLRHLCTWWYGFNRLGELLGAGAPLLSEVQLSNTSMPANLHLLRGLTSLELMDQPHYEEPPSLLDFRNVLTQCPALRHLGLDGCGFASDLDIRSLHPDPLYLPLLKSLKICFVNYWIEEDSCVQVLFDVFGAPNLDSLQLVSLSRNTCEAFIRVLEKKPLACGSESLCLLYLHSGEEGARINLGASLSARMLALFPNVQHLWIDADKEDGDDFIIALQWNKEPLCTSLHTLTLNIGSGQFEVLDNGGTYLRDFIAGRETNGLPITTLRLYPASEAYQATELLSWCHEKVTMEVLGDREIEFDCFEMSEKMVPSLMNLH